MFIERMMMMMTMMKKRVKNKPFFFTPFAVHITKTN